jgi:hypothetical protein
MQKDRNELYDYIKNNSKSLSLLNSRKIKDIDFRVIDNLKKIDKFEIPADINTIYELLLYVDPDLGKCKCDDCHDMKKIKAGRKWILNDFCSRECADLNFSKNQTDNNTAKRMTIESKERMKSKLSSIVKEKIKNGDFTPGITNSWCHSKIRVLIKGSIFEVRSSWEAFFYILNPNFLYESIRIPYYDQDKKKFRNYIVDFCDSENRILYEIKPNNKIKESNSKEKGAREWCKINNYSFIYISDDWIKKNYNRDLLMGQPEFEKISVRIEKSLKYKIF